MSWIKNRIGSQCVFTVVATVWLASLSTQHLWAQQGTIRAINSYRVKSDRVGDFQAEIKEYTALVKKGGSSRYYSTWHSLTGPNEYTRVDYYTKWADLDVLYEPKMKEHAADLQRLAMRIVQCTESSRRIIDEVLPDLSLPRDREMPKMIRAVRTTVRPDKINDYLALVKSDLLPAAKKSGLTTFSVAQTRYGARSSEFLTVAGLSNWADLEGGFGVQKALGEEGYQRFLAKLRPLTLESEFNIYRLEPDLSYLAPSSSSTTGN